MGALLALGGFLVVSGCTAAVLFVVLVARVVLVLGAFIVRGVVDLLRFD